MTNESFHSHSVKENFKADIEESRRIGLNELFYEYFDDHTYSGSKKIGMLIKEKNGKWYLYLFQEKGPQNEGKMQKLLEWRRSGKSNEIGHKGGGNKRLIFGMLSTKTTIISKTPNGIIMMETNPMDIFNLANSDISEQDFRVKVDSSTYVKTPEKIDDDNLPKWYSDTYEEIRDEFEIEPNYMTRMELKDIPKEFKDNKKWNEFINKIRAKQYDIPIIYKNEILGMKKVEEYENIDLVGLKSKQHLKKVTIYINTDDNSFVLGYNCKDNDTDTDNNIDTDNDADNNDDDNLKMYNIINKCEVTDKSKLSKWGDIDMFVAIGDKFKEEFDKYNKGHDNTLKHEDCYGVYFIINGKLTNFKRIEGNGNLLSEGKNNNICKKDGKFTSTNKFRMVFKPNNEETFDKLIQTATIKAQTKFLDTSEYKNIISHSMNIYRGKYPHLDKEKSKPKVKTAKENNDIEGCVYVIYLGNDLYKFGLVHSKGSYPKRERQHKKESKEKVKHFTGKELEHENATPLSRINTKSPQGAEEKIAKILEDNEFDEDGEEVITLFKNDGSKTKCREYFMCTKIDFILQNIIPLIENELDENN